MAIGDKHLDACESRFHPLLAPGSRDVGCLEYQEFLPTTMEISWELTSKDGNILVTS